DLDLDFWTHPSHVGGPVDIRVSDANYPRLAKLLYTEGIVFTILIPDVYDLQARQNPPQAGIRSGVFDYAMYHKLSEINSEVDRLVQHDPSIATKFSVGKSYNGKQMYAVKVNRNLSSGPNKKILFMNCGIHAREWITPATCMYMLNQIITKYGADSSINALLNKMDVVIMPVLNVDGYEYTWTNNRMWRKTRSRQANGCYGADPNRNWNVKWGGVGTSTNPCRDTYHGPYPFSEVESRNVARYLHSIRSRLVGYMDIHAYSQLWMTPWGHGKGQYPPTYQEMMRVANIAVKALYNAGYRTSYRAGTSADIIFIIEIVIVYMFNLFCLFSDATTGGTMDWVTARLGVTYSYGLELRDTGRYGFALPANQIIPTGKETFAAIKAMVTEMRI
ncbi:hypothetical protein QZH41_009715, partial [Actinostola sp. cb2023]